MLLSVGSYIHRSPMLALFHSIYDIRNPLPRRKVEKAVENDWRRIRQGGNPDPPLRRDPDRDRTEGRVERARLERERDEGIVARTGS